MSREEIKNELLQIGYLGTMYLQEAIYYIVYEHDKISLNLEKDFYIELAKKYDKNIQTIKSDIIKATNNINYSNQYLEKQYHMANLDNMKLTPKLVISLISNRIKDLE